MNRLPKVLVAAPTSDAKNYCLEEWIENTMSFTYPNYKIRLFDNSDDDGKNLSHILSTYKKLHGSPSYLGKFNAEKTYASNLGLMERICLSHNDCVKMLILGNYDYILHLESDVFPQKDIIERLLWNNVDVVGAVYHSYEGKERAAVLQHSVEHWDGVRAGINFGPTDDIFMDGNLMQVAHVGLGCVLIKSCVFDKVSFRVDPNYPNHSADSFFAHDCASNGIPIYCDPQCVAKHLNKKWND